MDETELLSINQYTADGVETEWELSFAGGYLSRDHIVVRVFDDDTLTSGTSPAFTFVSDYVISITPAVEAGKVIRIYRSTPFNAPIVDFSDGSIINEATLDVNAKQAVFLAAELRDRFGTTVDIDNLGELVGEAEAAAQAAQESADEAAGYASSLSALAAQVAALLGTDGSSLVQFRKETGATNRTVQAELRNRLPHPYQYGAAGNGSTDDRTALNTTNSKGAWELHPGTYLISSNLTISNAVRFNPGAIIRVASGVTLNITGPIDAPIAQIFDCVGTGAVTINPERNTFAVPEWWGINADGSGAFPNIQRALNCGIREVRLLQRDYFGSGGLIVPAYVHLKGMGMNYQGPNTATRLLSSSPSGYVVLVGNLTNAGGTFGSSPRGIRISDFYVGRTVAHVGSDPDATGVHVGFCLDAIATRVRAGGPHTQAWRFGGSVFFKGYDLRAKRDVAAASGTDLWYGYKTGGIGGLSSIGENASLYLLHCQSEFNLGSGFDSHHIHMSGPMTDTFIHDFECVSGRYGITIEGDSNDDSELNTANDIHILRPTIDQTTVRGFFIHNVRKAGFISIVDAYVGMPSGRALMIDGCLGRIDIQHIECYNHVGSEPAISITDSNNVHMRAFVSESTVGCVTGNIVGCDLEVHCTNITRDSTAIFQNIGGATYNVFKASADGSEDKITYGYQTFNQGSPWGTNDHNEFHITRLKNSNAVTNVSSFGVGSDTNSITIGVA